MLAHAARAAADIADADPTTDRRKLEQRLREAAEESASFVAHPARVLCAAAGLTFDAELARLRHSGEEPAWRAAKDIWATYGVPHHAAYGGWRLAECLLASGRRSAAETELATAHLAAEGHVPMRTEMEAFARRARMPLSPTSGSATSDASPAEPDSPLGLTPRELDVLRLLGTGATNAEIGRRLYMSPKTASVHVTAILRKLRATGRVQAATIAERMGLLAGEDQDHVNGQS